MTLLFALRLLFLLALVGATAWLCWQALHHDAS